VREELLGYSDFSLHAFCYSNGPDFAQFRLNQSHMMASAKFRFLEKLLLQVGGRGERVWGGQRLGSGRCSLAAGHRSQTGSLALALSLSAHQSPLPVTSLQLKSVGSRPLIFSQWTAVLDIIEWLMEVMQLPYVRLDGSTGALSSQLSG
jgi:SWI/SNF-related matrix-associated actin-dependent regulator 1 of chromatin subfamily A